MLWEPLCLFCPTAPIVKPSSRNRGIVRVFRPLRNPLGDGHQVTCDPRGDIDRPDGVLLRDHTVNVNSTTLRQQPTLWLWHPKTGVDLIPVPDPSPCGGPCQRLADELREKSELLFVVAPDPWLEITTDVCVR